MNRPDLADYKDEIHHPNGTIEDRLNHSKYVEDLEKYVDYLEANSQEGQREKVYCDAQKCNDSKGDKYNMDLKTKIFDQVASARTGQKTVNGATNEILAVVMEAYAKSQEGQVNVETAIVGNTVLEAVRQIESLDEQVLDYIYPKLYTLYNRRKLNKGHLPVRRPAKEAVTIREFSSNGDKISVDIDIWWGGDCYDDEQVTLTCDEWDAIKDDTPKTKDK